MKKLLLNIYIINILINAITLQKILKIPFIAHHTSYLFKNKPDIILNKYMTELVIELSIGTPPQKLNISLDLNNNFYSFFLSKNLSHINFTSIYNKSISSTYNCEKKREYFFIEIFFNSAEVFTDNIILNNEDSNIENKFKMLLIDNLNKNIYTPGIIGLTLKKDNRQIDEYSFLYQLRKLDLIDTEIFYLNFEDEDKGKLIIGENLFNDEEYLKIKVGYIPQIDSKLLWCFNFDTVYHGNAKLLDVGDSVLSLDYGLIVGPSDYGEKMNKFFIQENNCFLNYTSIGSLYLKFFWCNEDINFNIENKYENLTFELKSINYNFTFTGKDLFFNVGNIKYFKILFLFEHNQPYWYLGHIFLQKYKLRFDHEKKLIYIPIKEQNNNVNYDSDIIKNDENNDNDILNLFNQGEFWIVASLLIVIIGLIVFIVIYIKKYPKKKKGYELDDAEDDYDYINSKKIKINENNIKNETSIN